MSSNLDRRSLLQAAAAFLVASVAPSVPAAPAPAPALVPPNPLDGPLWNTVESTPLEDMRRAIKLMEADTGLRPTPTLWLNSAHRAYILAHFKIDVAEELGRNAIARECGFGINYVSSLT